MILNEYALKKWNFFVSRIILSEIDVKRLILNLMFDKNKLILYYEKWLFFFFRPN